MREGGGYSSSSTQAFWLSMHRGKPMSIDRVKDGYMLVPQSCVSLFAGTQPGTLQRLMTQARLEAGLPARILFTSPPGSPMIESDFEPDMTLIDQWTATHGLLTSIAEGTVIRLSDEAREVWKNYLNGPHCDEHRSLNSHLRAVWSKLRGALGRVALVLHCLEWAADKNVGQLPQWLTPETMQKAIDFIHWQKGEARRVYGMLDETPQEAGYRGVFETIRRLGSASAAEVFENHKDVFDRRRQKCRQFLQSCVGEGTLVRVPVESGPTGGRPTDRYALPSATS